MEASVILELIGISAFALVGVLVGLEYELDIFGIFVVSICSALAGGVIRDLVLGKTPPTSFVNYTFVLTVIVTVAVSLILFKIFDKKINAKGVKWLKKVINFFDAVGLGIFTVGGCETAYAMGFGNNLILMVFVGVVTAVGGGMIRDVLASRKPVVLRKDLYAVISVFGALGYYFLRPFGLALATYIIAGLIILVRLLATWRRYDVHYHIDNEELKRDE